MKILILTNFRGLHSFLKEVVQALVDGSDFSPKNVSQLADVIEGNI